MTILGISIGTIRTGICVLKDGTLLDRHIHNYDDVWSTDKLRIIMNRYRGYITKHNVTAIMVKIPPVDKHTKPITRMLKKIERLAKRHDCLFDLITKGELKSFTGTRSTSELIECTRRLYPELSPLFEKGKQSYYKKLFEAVLSAHIFKEWQRRRAIRLAHTTE
jgi:RNase H-fold protein (predicted Holliday junction resolvase)